MVGLLCWLQVPLRCQVDAISFSAHADFAQTSEFLDILQPPHVVLVHGEATGKDWLTGRHVGAKPLPARSLWGQLPW